MAFVLGGLEAGLAVVRSLGRRGIPIVAVVTSRAEQAHASRYVSTGVIGPDPDEDERGFVSCLMGLSDRFGGGVLVPTTDEAVGAVAANAGELGTRHWLACPPLDVASRFLDKQLTYNLAAEIGVRAPGSITPQGETDVERCAAEMRFPCLVKPRESFRYSRAFGVKMKRVNDAQELLAAWREADEAGITTMVQELIPGPETGGVNYNAHFADGKPVAELTARKVRLAPRDFGFPTAVVSDSVPEVVEPARAILRALGLEGFANVEFKRDARDGRYKLLEVNGRPNMSGQLAVRCGVDFPFLSYAGLIGLVTPAFGPPTLGVTWINELSDPLAVLQRLRRRELPLRTALAPYVSRRVFATLAFSDPAPFMTVAPQRARRLFARLR